MIIIALILGLIVAKIFGNLDLKNLKIKYYPLLGLGIVIDLLMILMTSIDFGFLTWIFIKYYGIFHFIYLIIFEVVLILNRQNLGLQISGLGFLLNSFPIIFNGKMPVDARLVYLLGDNRTKIILDDKSLSHGVIDSAKFLVLSDIIYLPFPYATIISIGDILISIGLFLAIIINANVIKCKENTI